MAANRPTTKRIAQNIETEPDVVEGLPVTRIRTGVMALRQSGKIGPAEVIAAERWYRDYAFGLCGARESGASGSGGGSDGFSAARVDAITRYNRAKAALGTAGDALLRAFVADGVSLTRTAELANMNPHNLSGMVALVLIQLAEHYNREDGSGFKPPLWAIALSQASERLGR